MSNCTWVDCDRTATHPQIGKDGGQWANLCELHDAELSRAIGAALSPGGIHGIKRMLSGWVKAQGGAGKAAERMTR